MHYYHKNSNGEIYYALHNTFIEWIFIFPGNIKPMVGRIHQLKNFPVFVMGAATAISSQQYQQALLKVMESEAEVHVF